MIRPGFLFLALIILTSSNIVDSGRYEKTSHGPVINWTKETYLKWEDFKAKKKASGSFAVAASTCGFGYDGIIKGDEISVNVYVRFYCNESWHHKDYKLKEVLRHEQLHFDICELYGRIFYKNILLMRKKGQLTERNMKKVLNELMVEYDETQEQYDDETNHSTDGLKQQQWNKKINNALNDFAQYAYYKEF